MAEYKKAGREICRAKCCDATYHVVCIDKKLQQPQSGGRMTCLACKAAIEVTDLVPIKMQTAGLLHQQILKHLKTPTTPSPSPAAATGLITPNLPLPCRTNSSSSTTITTTSRNHCNNGKTLRWMAKQKVPTVVVGVAEGQGEGQGPPGEPMMGSSVSFATTPADQVCVPSVFPPSTCPSMMPVSLEVLRAVMPNLKMFRQTDNTPSSTETLNDTAAPSQSTRKDTIPTATREGGRERSPHKSREPGQISSPYSVEGDKSEGRQLLWRHETSANSRGARHSRKAAKGPMTVWREKKGPSTSMPAVPHTRPKETETPQAKRPDDYEAALLHAGGETPAGGGGRVAAQPPVLALPISAEAQRIFAARTPFPVRRDGTGGIPEEMPPPCLCTESWVSQLVGE
ncbi:unnamed protein product [Vitrella brassicaformis CCMP3155]|uniref:Uncharacterized protein n=2 Tax=Vitrella brassicaformis TaxID=1169539 RepID=A0A0G4FPF1_VITBC|nr:unnamed protein product [Vitrella brassicaformis CCMP3155]|eukprot:CEM16175.1 unnamed protein product [Vitrella brassicaformis CCMP3155]